MKKNSERSAAMRFTDETIYTPDAIYSLTSGVFPQ